MAFYKLTRQIFINNRSWPVGTVLEFEEGKQPKTARPFDPEEPVEEVEEVPEPDTLLALSKQPTNKGK